MKILLSYTEVVPCCFLSVLCQDTVVGTSTCFMQSRGPFLLQIPLLGSHQPFQWEIDKPDKMAQMAFNNYYVLAMDLTVRCTAYDRIEGLLDLSS